MPTRTVLLLLALLILGPSTTLAEIKVGWIGPLTGNAAVLGVDTIPAIEIAFGEANAKGGINGHKLTLVAEDDQYQTAKTVAAYNRLVHKEGIKILFVLTYGGVAAIADKAERDGVIVIDTLDCDDTMAQLPPNTLCIAKTTEGMGYAVADLVLADRNTPSAVVYFDGDPFMGILAQSLISRLSAGGHPPTLVETYNDSTTAFRQFSTRVRAKGDIKSVILLGYDQLGRAARTLRESGISSQFYGVNTATSPGFQELAGKSADGMKGAAFRAPESQALEVFEEAFVKRVGRRWRFETSAIPSYDAATLVTNALLTGAFDPKSQTVLPDKLRETLLSTRGYQGVSGTITIDPDGVTRSIGVVPVQFSGGKSERIVTTTAR